MLYNKALASAPLLKVENNLFFLPITMGFIDRSAELLSNSKEPSSRNTSLNILTHFSS